MGSIIDKPTCVNCAHSMERDHANVWCRRYPPTMAFVQVGKTSMLTIPGGGQAAQIQGEWISTFPSMQKTAPGCGEWKPTLQLGMIDTPNGPRPMRPAGRPEDFPTTIDERYAGK